MLLQLGAVIRVDASLHRQGVTGTSTNTEYLTSVLNLEGTGKTLRGPDTDQYSSHPSDLSLKGVNGSIEMGGPVPDSIDRPQRLNKITHIITEQTQTCAVRHSRLAGSCARPTPSLATGNLHAGAPACVRAPRFSERRRPREARRLRRA